MAAKRPVRRFWKIVGIVAGILLALLVGFHFWLQAHARRIIEEMVSSKSNGRLKLKIHKLRFNYFNRKIELENAVFYNTDTATGTTAYNFTVEHMRLRAKALLPIVFKKQLQLDSLYLFNPVITVTKLRDGPKPDSSSTKEVSIPEEMGKVYKSIQDALQVLQVKRFEISGGTFSLINRVNTGELPLKVSNINFYIDNLEVNGSEKGKEKILFSDNVVLNSDNQDILFPDGRHRLKFKNFRINLQEKRVVFDSCTIAATRTDSANASFQVFFKKLSLTNIDFDTLYKSEVIKADSVYCLDPAFDLEVEVAKRKGARKDPPRLEKIVQQLTGDLLLGYVVVDNASFNIKTTKEGVPSTFTFSNNNFEMQGLKILQQAKKPIEVKSFVLAIRNYQNFIKDSAYSVQFDSVLFKDNRITLSNFLFTKFDDNNKTVNTFSIPQFNLFGLSWDDLVFERKLKAEQAILFNPHIRYSVSTRKNRQRQSIFESLGVANEFMDLQQIDIVDGNLDLKLKNDISVRLDNATLSVRSHSLLESKRISGIRNSISQVRFNKGVIHAGNLLIQLDDISYVGKSGQFEAGHVSVDNKLKSIAIGLNGVSVTKMQVDESIGDIRATGVRWKSGTVNLQTALGAGGSQSRVRLDDVRGQQTSIAGLFSGNNVSTFLQSISFNSFEKRTGQGILLDGLQVNGIDLNVMSQQQQLNIRSYFVGDDRISTFKDVTFSKQNNGNKINVSAPALSTSFSIQQLIDGNYALGRIMLSRPVINVENTDPVKKGNAAAQVPSLKVEGITMTNPTISYSKTNEKGRGILNWNGGMGENKLVIDALDINGNLKTIGRIRLDATDFSYRAPSIKQLISPDKFELELSSMRFDQREDEPAEWQGTLDRLYADHFELDSIQLSRPANEITKSSNRQIDKSSNHQIGSSISSLLLNDLLIKNLHISSANLVNMQQLVAENNRFSLAGKYAAFENEQSLFRFHNPRFNRDQNKFMLDSFFMKPRLELDSFIAIQQFQKDYSTLQTGAVTIGPVDLDNYIRNKTLLVQSVKADHLLLTDYKDRELPFNAGIIKPLAVNTLKNVKQLFSIDTVLLTRARVVYTEKNEKTRATGTIPIGNMQVRMNSVKNFGVLPNDSLSIVATGMLMDTAWIRLRVRESYSDTLGGFLMTLEAKPLDLRILNPALVPLGAVRIESGILDTLNLRAVGREYLAWGEMKMFYHDLKVRVLNKKDENKKGLWNNLLNFFANTFVIKNKNTSRTGKAFFIRQRDRSAINYLIKIAFSGMSSSVGVKRNKKLEKKYQRELDKRKLPAIDLHPGLPE